MSTNLISESLGKLSRLFNRLANHFQYNAKKNNTQSQRVKPWFDINGDTTLRLDYDLNENDIVVDLGGYRGDWSAAIFCKYACKIHIFEPYQPYATAIKERFIKNKNINVYNFGLGSADELLQLNVLGNESSTFKGVGKKVMVELRNAITFFEKQQINSITLLKINIEGGEYDLLDHLTQSAMISKITNIQVQFHDFVPNAEARMKDLQEKLAKTHTLTYQYEFVWENWQLKPEIENGE